mmetsp:Transcript_41704/g.65103  ORF Transcript_41704/g.65103 Transcript_41704/m.65103 type:complete len:360 (-) Transcript_41704:112-1191(-)
MRLSELWSGWLGFLPPSALKMSLTLAFALAMVAAVQAANLDITQACKDSLAQGGATVDDCHDSCFYCGYGGGSGASNCIACDPGLVLDVVSTSDCTGKCVNFTAGETLTSPYSTSHSCVAPSASTCALSAMIEQTGYASGVDFASYNNDRPLSPGSLQPGLAGLAQTQASSRPPLGTGSTCFEGELSLKLPFCDELKVTGSVCEDSQELGIERLELFEGMIRLAGLIFPQQTCEDDVEKICPGKSKVSDCKYVCKYVVPGIGRSLRDCEADSQCPIESRAGQLPCCDSLKGMISELCDMTDAEIDVLLEDNKINDEIPLTCSNTGCYILAVEETSLAPALKSSLLGAAVLAAAVGISVA